MAVSSGAGRGNGIDELVESVANGLRGRGDERRHGGGRTAGGRAAQRTANSQKGPLAPPMINATARVRSR